MRTRLTATIALAAMIFSALLVIGSSNAGAQDRLDVQDEEETVLVCKLDGLDWVLYEMDVLTAEYWLDNGGQLAGAAQQEIRLHQSSSMGIFTPRSRATAMAFS